MVATYLKYGCGVQLAFDRQGYWYDKKDGSLDKSSLHQICGKPHAAMDAYPEVYFLCERCVKRLGLIW